MMTIWLALNARFWVSFGLSLIIGGALGNVIDRVRFHAVADFIDAHYQQHHWPAFNVADSCIVAGAGILMLSSFFGNESTKRNK
jgi:signal peptidase II